MPCSTDHLLLGFFPEVIKNVALDYRCFTLGTWSYWMELKDITDWSQCHTMTLKAFHTIRPVKGAGIYLPVEKNSNFLH